MATKDDGKEEMGREQGRPEFGVQTLIRPWSGETGAEPVERFLRSIEIIASRARWTDADKKMICLLKLTGAAATCVEGHPELLEPDTTFEAVKIVLMRRFSDRTTPEQRLLELNSMTQFPREGVQEFADRCRVLAEKTLPTFSTPEEARILRGQLEKVLLAAFVNGVRGEARLQLRYHPPQSFEEAVATAVRVETVRAEENSRDWVPAVQGVAEVDAVVNATGQGGVCFSCHQRGHMARNCPKRRGIQRTGRTMSSRTRDTLFCFVCGEAGHFARECPRRARGPKVNYTQVRAEMGDPKGEGPTSAPASTVGADFVIPRVKVNRIRGVTVPFNVGNRCLTLLVDSGSEISILKNPIPGISIDEPSVSASGVTGTEVPIQGEQLVFGRLGDRKIQHRFFISHVATKGDGLLGWDVMAKMGLIIDAKRGCVVMEEDRGKDIYSCLLTEGPVLGAVGKRKNLMKARPEVVCEEEGGNAANESVVEVKAAGKRKIAPYCEMLVEGKLERCLPGDMILEPVVQRIGGLRIARSLYRPGQRRVWVRLVNLTKSEISINKGELLGTASCVPSTPVLITEEQQTIQLEGKLLEKLAHLNKREQESVRSILMRYSALFEEPGKEGCKLPVYHRIETEGGPIARPPYRAPFAQRPIIAEHINQMLEKGIIKQSDSPWSAPIVLVPKKTSDGSLQYRFCTDFRGLNKVTKADAYPLPRIVETLELLGRSQFFSTLDLACGYHQIPIRPEDREKTAFSTNAGHYEYTRMAFGLMNAPATFQRMMDQLLAEIKGDECFIYIDDIIIFSATFEEHCRRLERVLARLQAANLKVRIEKCHFVKTEVKYLGHVITSEGVRPDPDKLAAVRSFPTPTTSKELKSFLGLAGYYRRFIRHFADTAKPLTGLLKKKAVFFWGMEQKRAFDRLRESLCGEVVLMFPDFREPFILATDASGCALGAILSQLKDGVERPVAYASRQLNKAETNYSATERELLAVVWATTLFRCYLLGRKFTLVTDHAALQWMLRVRDESARLTRWSLRLMEYDYEVIHRPGCKHQNADALSRVVAGVERKGIDLDESKLKDCQEEDEWCQSVRRDTPNKVKQAENGLWYWTCGEQDQGKWRIMTPVKLRNHVLHMYHSTPWSGHPGIEKSITRIKRWFYWPSMKTDIERYVMKCALCKERKTPRKLKVPLGQTFEATFPLEQVSLDIVGPLPMTRSGCRYLLTFIDGFTRYAEAIPLREQTAEETANAFVQHIVLRHGVPKRILTDQGRNFISELFRVTCQLLGMKKIQTSAYHPQSNGMIERFHRTLEDIMSFFVQKDGRDWDRWVPYALLAYRSTTHASTGYSPHYLMYGRDLELPFECDLTLKPMSVGVEEYVRALQKRFESAYSIAWESGRSAKKSWTKAYDKGKEERRFEVGQSVYILEPATPVGHCQKFRRPWTGPHVIVEQTSPWNYKVSLASGGYSVIHINRLKAAEMCSYETKQAEDDECAVYEESPAADVEQDGVLRRESWSPHISTGDREGMESEESMSVESMNSSWSPEENDADLRLTSRSPYLLRSRSGKES